MTPDSQLARAPQDAQRYVHAVAREVATVFGDALVGVYTTGSLALGGFTPGRSDIDLMAVVDGHQAPDTCLDLAVRLDHRRMPCPASGLEFVLYPSAIVTTPSTDAGYLLNLNTGPKLAPLADLDSTSAPAFWFVLDRAISAQSGEAVVGPPAAVLFRVPPAHELLPVVLAAVEAQQQDRSDLLDNVVLNACRAFRFAQDGRWYSKARGGSANGGNTRTLHRAHPRCAGDPRAGTARRQRPPGTRRGRLSGPRPGPTPGGRHHGGVTPHTRPGGEDRRRGRPCPRTGGRRNGGPVRPAWTAIPALTRPCPRGRTGRREVGARWRGTCRPPNSRKRCGRRRCGRRRRR